MVTCLPFPRVILFTSKYLLLLLVQTCQIPHLYQDKNLGYDKRAQGESITQVVGRLAIYLTSHSTRGVTHCQLNTNGRRTSILRSYVDVEPRQVQADQIVHANATDITGEISDSIVAHSKQERVADGANHVCYEQELSSVRHCRARHCQGTHHAGPIVFVGQQSDADERHCPKNVDRNGHVVACQGTVSHAIQLGNQER